MAPDADAGKSLNSRPDPFAPLTSQLLPVGDGHEIHVESVGRADGIPAVYLHGGPGSGCQPDHRRLFDPERFHAVLFDQRGAGRSRPKGRREDNTLPHLIADMETIREKLPEGFQRSEFLLEKGAIDMIVDRRELRDELPKLLTLLQRQPLPSA